MSELTMSGDVSADIVYNSDGTLVRGLLEMDNSVRIALAEHRGVDSTCSSCGQYVPNGGLFEQFGYGEDEISDYGIKCADCVESGAERDVILARKALTAAQDRLEKIVRIRKHVQSVRTIQTIQIVNAMEKIDGSINRGAR